MYRMLAGVFTPKKITPSLLMCHHSHDSTPRLELGYNHHQRCRLSSSPSKIPNNAIKVGLKMPRTWLWSTPTLHPLK